MRRRAAMEEEMMVAHAAFAGELRKKLAIRPEQKMSSPSRGDEPITERLLSACADLAHANTLVAHAASDVLDAFFELSRTRRVSFSTVTEDEHVETVVDALLDVARGADVSKLTNKRMTNKRARGERDALEHRRARGAARSANALRMALKRETHETRITRMRRNTSDGPRLGHQQRRRAPAAGENETTRKRRSTVLDGVAGRLDAVARCAAAYSAPVGPNVTADADAGFLWKTSALRLVVETSRALDERGESEHDPARWRARCPSTRRTTPRAKHDPARRASPLKKNAPKPPSSAALELMIQAFSRDGDGARRPPPAYYAHAAFVACDALYARKGRRAPKAFVSAAITSGALAWPSAFARTETADGPFPVTFVDVASNDGAVSTRSRATSDLPRHNTAATYRHAWLMAFRAGRGPELEAWSSKEGPEDETEVAWPSPRGAGAETSARRLVSVFLDDDDALWDFMECVLKAAEMEQEEEEEMEEEMDGEEEEEEEEEEGGNAGFSVARRLGWTSSGRDGPTPSAVFLALLELLAWDVDTLEATLREDAAATVLGYIGLARQFAHEWPARDAEKLLRFCEAFASKLGAKAARTRPRKRAGNRAPEALDPEGFRDAPAAFALDPLRAAIAAARERLEG